MEKDNEVIVSSYTDREAVEDGVLVALSPRDRVTSNLWHWVVQHTQKQTEGAACWPVDLMRFCFAHTAEETTRVMLEGLIERYRAAAIRTYDLNIDGGIWVAMVHYRRDVIVRLEPNVPTGKDSDIACRIWIMPNELGGVTVMLPADY